VSNLNLNTQVTEDRKVCLKEDASEEAIYRAAKKQALTNANGLWLAGQRIREKMIMRDGASQIIALGLISDLEHCLRTLDPQPKG